MGVDTLVAFDDLLTNRLHCCTLCGTSAVWDGVWLCENQEAGRRVVVAYALCWRCVEHDPVRGDGMRAGVDRLLRHRYGFEADAEVCALC